MSATGEIPNRLNAVVVATQISIVIACIAALKFVGIGGAIAIGVVFIVTLNSIYFAIHEAEHGVLFSNRTLNSFTGVVLALFLPASYTMVRLVHLAHHIHNRSDEESFDIYFESEPTWWKKLQFFGILTGFLWLTMALSNIAFALLPMRWISRAMKIDRQSGTMMAYLERHNSVRIRLESAAAIALHAAICCWLGRSAIVYAIIYAAFGWSWSTLQYVHHYRTSREVLRGAKNLRYGRILDFIWLHHGWHLTHHLHPTASWRDLPKLAGDGERATESLGAAYLRMWRGPVLSEQHVKNCYDGSVAQT